MDNDFQLDDDVLALLGELSQKLYQRVDVQRLPSGSLELDWVLGGGWPRGQLSEIVGHNNRGKTTLTLITMADMMARNPQSVAALIDVEHAFDKEWAKAIGVQLPRLAHFTPDSAEDALETVRSLLSSKAKGKGVDLIVLDSIQALSAGQRNEADMGDQHVALEARMIADFLRKIGHDLKMADVPLIVINGMYSLIGVMMGNPWQNYGGQALSYKRAISIEMLTPKPVVGDKDTPMEGETVGHNFRFKNRKNKTAPPFREGEMPFRVWPFVGPDTAVEIFEVGRRVGIITREDGSPHTPANSTAYYDGNKLAAGRQNTIDLLYQDEDLREELYNAIRETF